MSNNVFRVNTFSFRLRRKLQEHLASNPTGLSLLKYIIKWCFIKLCKKGTNLFVSPPQIPIENNIVKIAVKITGGLGDYIVLGRVLKDLLTFIGNSEFYIFVPNTKYAEWLFQNMPEVKEVYPEHLLDKCLQYFDCCLHLNTLVFFNEQHINVQKIKKTAPRLLEVFDNTVRKRRNWNIFIDNHPVLDGAFARQVVALGYNRYSFIHHCLGIPNSGNSFNIQYSDEEAKVVADKFKHYITLNTGFDHQFVIGSRFATKCYPVKYWETLVGLVKKRYPELGIIQIGGKNSPTIKGCDVHYENKLSLSLSAGVLKKSLLHIDIEGGLVHLCAALGTKCVVLFGPTSKKYFAYPENINIQVGECHNCWWASERWMECCPQGLDVPQCMYQLLPETVYEHISVFLKNQGICDDCKA